MHSAPEPSRLKEGLAKKNIPFLERQNEHSKVYNNCTRMIAGEKRLARGGYSLPAGGELLNNYTGETPMLTDPVNLDFRPKAGSPLIDAGRVIPSVTDGFQGKSPDIGAYEYGGQQWVPGITWSKKKLAEHEQAVSRLMW